ncbi:MAG: hypothetical protein CM1200mP29_15060 [Verrucomicrobiota bacterium]|nr:MAG: hypothetical protein CM1200mP29_15060 [Verrucomicrobiota bacterium]
MTTTRSRPFFSQIGRKNAEDPRGKGDRVQSAQRRCETPGRWPYHDAKVSWWRGPEITPGAQDRRAVLATWLASADNPFFAPNLANIIWAHFFGIGIIEPVDDVRVRNPASNPELLAALAKRFTEYNYDFKRLVYGHLHLADVPARHPHQRVQAADTRNFAHGRIRRLRAEVLLDVITQVTQTKNKFKGLPLGARAVQIADGNVGNYFLTTFGRATRETVCSCEVKMEPSLSQRGCTSSMATSSSHGFKAAASQGNYSRSIHPPRCFDNSTSAPFAVRHPTTSRPGPPRPTPKGNPGKKAGMDDVFWALLTQRNSFLPIDGRFKMKTPPLVAAWLCIGPLGQARRKSRIKITSTRYLKTPATPATTPTRPRAVSTSRATPTR